MFSYGFPMSELQTALLIIGFSVIAAVYAYGWWQQRRYRRKFGATFKTGHADALYQENDAMQAGRIQQPELTSLVDNAAGAHGAGLSATALPDESCALLDT